MNAANDSSLITVEVAYATPDKQSIIELEVPRGTTAYEAVEQSGIAEVFPEIDLANNSMGIFSDLMDGKKLPLPADYILQQKDRVEIYRPLTVDPKQARLARAAKKKAESAKQS